MRILAIETSCDETAAAVVEDGWKVLSNVIASSLKLHQKTGGIVPEIAARAQVESIIPVISEALKKAFPRIKNPEDKIDAIAVTTEPGLVTSLLVGTETAKWLAYLWKKPLIPVNHIRGHVYANWLGVARPAVRSEGALRSRARSEGLRSRNFVDFAKLSASESAVPIARKELIEFPVISLSVSGGHNELILLKEHKHFEVIGESQDDAAGEAFDKVARILGLGYPGGPAIELLSGEYKRNLVPQRETEKALLSQSETRVQGRATDAADEAKKWKKHTQAIGLSTRQQVFLSFPRAWLNQNRHLKHWDGTSFNFSFSGLKSEVIREVQRWTRDPSEIAHAFQEAVFDVLVTKLIGAAKKWEAKEIHIAGGVSANKRFRKLIKDTLKKENMEVTFRTPIKMIYCTDNAAMIGAAAFFTTETPSSVL